MTFYKSATRCDERINYSDEKVFLSPQKFSLKKQL